MPVINRNVTRSIKNSTESTLETRTNNSDTLAFNLQTSDFFYLGFKKPFSTRYFNISTANTNAASIVVKYWDGDSFEAVEDVVDQTQGFTQSGFLSWENKNDWKTKAQTPVTDVDLYWVEITVSANLSSGTILQSVPNLFCDDILLRTYYPELLSDTRYLPPGRTDFVEQYEAAKNYVVLRLKQDRLIDDESEIIDINEVAIAATRFTAWIILNPIAMDEADRERSDTAFRDANKELNRVKLDIDFDNTGIIEEDEKNIGDVYIPR